MGGDHGRSNKMKEVTLSAADLRAKDAWTSFADEMTKLVIFVSEHEAKENLAKATHAMVLRVIAAFVDRDGRKAFSRTLVAEHDMGLGHVLLIMYAEMRLIDKMLGVLDLQHERITAGRVLLELQRGAKGLELLVSSAD